MRYIPFTKPVSCNNIFSMNSACNFDLTLLKSLTTVSAFVKMIYFHLDDYKELSRTGLIYI